MWIYFACLHPQHIFCSRLMLGLFNITMELELTSTFGYDPALLHRLPPAKGHRAGYQQMEEGHRQRKRQPRDLSVA